MSELSAPRASWAHHGRTTRIRFENGTGSAADARQRACRGIRTADSHQIQALYKLSCQRCRDRRLVKSMMPSDFRRYMVSRSW